MYELGRSNEIDIKMIINNLLIYDENNDYLKDNKLLLLQQNSTQLTLTPTKLKTPTRYKQKVRNKKNITTEN